MVEGGDGVARPVSQLSEQELVPRDAPVASGRPDGGGEPVPVGQRPSDVVGGDVLEQVAAERAEACAGSGSTFLEERPRLGLAVGPAEALGLALVVVVEQRPPARVDADQAEPAILPLHEHRPARRQERRHLVQRDGPDGDLDPEEAAVGLHREEARDRWEDDLVPVERDQAEPAEELLARHLLPGAEEAEHAAPVVAQVVGVLDEGRRGGVGARSVRRVGQMREDGARLARPALARDVGGQARQAGERVARALVLAETHEGGRDPPEDLEVHYDDAADADSLYKLMEQQIIPLYYERDQNGLPHGWIQMLKESIRSIVPRFSASRMLKEYASRIYVPASRQAVNVQEK